MELTTIHAYVEEVASQLGATVTVLQPCDTDRTGHYWNYYTEIVRDELTISGWLCLSVDGQLPTREQLTRRLVEAGLSQPYTPPLFDTTEADTAAPLPAQAALW